MEGCSHRGVSENTAHDFVDSMYQTEFANAVKEGLVERQAVGFEVTWRIGRRGYAAFGMDDVVRLEVAERRGAADRQFDGEGERMGPDIRDLSGCSFDSLDGVVGDDCTRGQDGARAFVAEDS